jgi:hypothetical protein
VAAYQAAEKLDLHNTAAISHVAYWYQNSLQDAHKGDLLTRPTPARQRRALS